MKVVVIGPVKPFRGGIAHSNTTFCKYLSKNHQVKVLSFKRLFPKPLYPGKFQKEENKKPPKELNVEFYIDSINPFNWWNTVRKIRKIQPDTVIFQWWTTFLTPCYSFIAKRLKKDFRVSTVCQNVLPHEESKINSILTKMFFKHTHSAVTLSKSDQRVLEELMPDIKVKTIIEPVYDTAQQIELIPKKKAKQKLGIKKPSILFFGFVRAYKGLKYLLKAMPLILEKKDIDLFVVGEFWEGREKYDKIVEENQISENTKIVDKYVSDEEMALYFNACDAVVLPHVSSTESGIIQVAFGFNTPVITTNVGGNPDLIDHQKSGLLVPPKNPKKLAKAILEYYEQGYEEKFKREMKKNKKQFKWTKEKENAVLGRF